MLAGDKTYVSEKFYGKYTGSTKEIQQLGSYDSTNSMILEVSGGTR